MEHMKVNIQESYHRQMALVHSVGKGSRLVPEVVVGVVVARHCSIPDCRQGHSLRHMVLGMTLELLAEGASMEHSSFASRMGHKMGHMLQDK